MRQTLRFSYDFNEMPAIDQSGSVRLIASPFSLHDGEPIVVTVEAGGEGVLRVSDRAMAADSLAMEGIDLGKGAMAQSWMAVRGSVEERFLHLGVSDEWEILAYAYPEDLGEAISEVVAAVLRADGLSSLQRPKSRRKRLDQSVIQAARSAGLETLPNAPVIMKSGARRSVTARVSPVERPSGAALIQTFGQNRTGWDITDRASGLFGNLADGITAARVSVLSDEVSLDRYQMDMLKDVSLVLREHELPHWMVGLAA